MLPPASRAEAIHLRADLKAGLPLPRFEMQYRSVAGELRWIAVHASPLCSDDGTVVGSVVGLRDCQDEVLLRRARTTLSAGMAVLASAHEEGELLRQMCETAVADGGYKLAWYGRADESPGLPVVPVAHSAANAGYLDGIIVSWAEGKYGDGPTGMCIRSGVAKVVDDFSSATNFGPWRARARARGFHSAVGLPVFVDGRIDGALLVYAAEVRAFDTAAVAGLGDLATQLGYGLSRLRGAERLVAAMHDQALLSTAIDQAAESIVVTDTTPAIRYANPAALRATGYTLEELRDQNPRLFQSGLHDPAFYEAMWARLLGGETWHGVLLNRRKNGEIYEEDATITPVHDADGRRIAYVAVKHDLTRERSLEAVVTRDQNDREAVLGVMNNVRPGTTLIATADDLVVAVRRLGDIDGAMLIMVNADGVPVQVAVAGYAPPSHRLQEPLDVTGLDALIEVSRAGPWWTDLRDLTALAGVDPAFTASMRAEGFTATGYAPVHWEGDLLGVLSVATKAANAVEWMPARLSVLAELGSFAGMLLGPQADQHGRRGALRAEILGIIEHHRFRIVFEPVVDLTSRSPVGYEALTRFEDGRPPAERFAEAHAVGLGSELETACASAAMDGATCLPLGVWLSLNFAASTVIDGHAATLVKGAERPIVLEITEHVAIENYAAVRRAIDACGAVRLAVDDAGAGFASLRHILELQPDLIKLDIALVRDIDTDPARQALAAGMRHFAALTGTTLVAEGVETEAEARTIRQLGIDLAQGYLFGPATASA
jgi:PAS domain S-box-containing protein